jgi:hypothetical protein
VQYLTTESLELPNDPSTISCFGSAKAPGGTPGVQLYTMLLAIGIVRNGIVNEQDLKNACELVSRAIKRWKK